jgi:hypothetical protein
VPRELIDREFVAMKNDAEYQRVSVLIEQEFASNDRDTLRFVDKSERTHSPAFPSDL